MVNIVCQTVESLTKEDRSIEVFTKTNRTTNVGVGLTCLELTVLLSNRLNGVEQVSVKQVTMNDEGLGYFDVLEL